MKQPNQPWRVIQLSQGGFCITSQLVPRSFQVEEHAYKEVCDRTGCQSKHSVDAWPNLRNGKTKGGGFLWALEPCGADHLPVALQEKKNEKCRRPIAT